MGKNSQGKGNSNKVEWVKAFGTWAAAISVCVGVATFYLTKEKEASDRLLNIITLLDNNKCKMVRAGAASTIGVYLEDYKAYQDRACWIMANNLATNEDPLVRDNILNILNKATGDAIEPLACVNRSLVEEELHRLSFLLFRTDLAHRNDLDNGNISDDLRQEFENNGFRLYENTVVLIAEEGNRWLITSKGNDQKYTVRKEDVWLYIYRTDDPESFEMSPEEEFENLLFNDKLCTITEALSGVLMRERFPKEGKRYLHHTIVSNFNSPTKINLDNADFGQGDLRFARLRGISFKQANLKQAKLMYIFLSDVDLKQAELEQANLEKAYLCRVDLKRAKLKQANLESAKLCGVDLTEAVMCGANLFSANLEETILKGADLTDIFLFGMDAKEFQSDLDEDTVSENLQKEFEDNGIKLADNARIYIKKNCTEYWIDDVIDGFRKKYRISRENGILNVYSATNLDFAKLPKVDVTDALLMNVSLQEANLTRANMVKASLQGADFFKANLTYANLEGAHLEGANLEGANLEGAKLEGAHLEGANLENANFQDTVLEGVNISKAGNWQETVFDNKVRQEIMNQQD